MRYRSACAHCQVTRNFGRISWLNPPSRKPERSTRWPWGWTDVFLPTAKVRRCILDAHGRPMEEPGRQRLKARNKRPVSIQG